MFRLLTILAIIAASNAAPAPKPVVVYPPILPAYHPSVYHAPVVHPAPVAVSHYSTWGHHPVLPYRTVLPAALPPAPILY